MLCAGKYLLFLSLSYLLSFHYSTTVNSVILRELILLLMTKKWLFFLQRCIHYQTQFSTNDRKLCFFVQHCCKMNRERDTLNGIFMCKHTHISQVLDHHLLFHRIKQHLQGFLVSNILTVILSCSLTTFFYTNILELLIHSILPWRDQTEYN